MNPLHFPEQADDVATTVIELNKYRESNADSFNSNRASFRNSHHKRRESLLESATSRVSLSIIPSLIAHKDDKFIEPLLGRFYLE